MPFTYREDPMPGFIIDLDGTMYAGQDPIPHADEFIRTLRRNGWPYLFLTNNSSKHPQLVARHLASVAGIEASGDEVLTSSVAAARYVVEQNMGRRVMCIGEEGLMQALEEAGLEITEEAPDFVVQGIDRNFTYRKLELAVRHIRGGAAYVQTNPDHLLPTEGGLIPGAGSIAAAIKTASRAEAVVIGKPSPIILGYAIARLGLPVEDTWVVGDNIRTDIGGGLAAGCKTALTLTGLATPDNWEEQIRESGLVPDAVCRHLMELIDRLQRGVES